MPAGRASLAGASAPDDDEGLHLCSGIPAQWHNIWKLRYARTRR